MVKKERRIPVEVYSRVVGYFRPVDQWNKGKQEEFKERKAYRIPVNPKQLKSLKEPQKGGM